MSSDHSPSIKRALLFAGLLTLLQSLPWLPLLLGGISPVAFAAESVAYRYFHSFRLIRDDQSIIWEAQGQSMGVLQQFFQLLLDWFGVDALRSRMDLFSYGTLAFNSLVFGLVAWGLGRALPAGWRLRLLWAATGLFGIYGCWWGIFSARLPDYYTYEVTLTVTCLGLFMLWFQQPPGRPSALRALALGALAGVMIGIKITLIPIALLPLLPCLINTPGSPRTSLPWLAVWMTATAGTLAATLVAYYRFDAGHLLQAFDAWRSFVSAPGAEPGFISRFLHPFSTGNNPWIDHRFIPVIAVLWLTALAALVHAGFRAPARCRELLVLGAFVLVGSALHVWAVFKRPAETTLFESALFLFAVSAALLSRLPARPAYQKTVALWLTLAFGWCLFSGLKQFPSPRTMALMKATSRNAWEIHDWLNATERPIVVLLPDNRHVSGTVEETLLKGFSEVPTWNITSGYALLDIVAPRRLFVTQISAAPAGSVLLWTDVPGIPDLADLTRTPPVVLGQVPREVRTWPMQRAEFWPRTVHAAVFAETEDPVGATLREWRNASPLDPLAGLTISPADAAPRLELRTEAGRQIVRITATQPTPYLALGGAVPVLPEGAGRLRVQATLRTSTARSVLWQLHGTPDDAGRPDSVVESLPARSGQWLSWTIEKPRPAGGNSAGNFSVGIAQAQPGDWVEIASLSLQAGVAAPANAP